jgi:hypothetical protein
MTWKFDTAISIQPSTLSGHSMEFAQRYVLESMMEECMLNTLFRDKSLKSWLATAATLLLQPGPVMSMRLALRPDNPVVVPQGLPPAAASLAAVPH